MSRVVVAILMLALLNACGGKGDSSLSTEALANTEYATDFGAGRVKLTDGVFSGPNEGLYKAGVTPPEIRIALLDVRGSGHLNEDDSTDAAVVLVAKTEGTTGVFYQLVAVINEDGKPNPVASVFLGDRVTLQSVAIAGHQITVKMRVQTPSGGACCPVADETRVYALNGTTLALVSQTD